MTDSSTSETINYTYDVFGNLKTVVLPTKTVNYSVDAHNRRVAKKNGPTVEKYYVWNNSNQLIGVTDSSGQLLARFVYGSKAHVPDYMIESSTGNEFQIITNHLGSPVVVIDKNSGVVAQEMKYDEFGVVLADSNPGFTPFGFAGCLYDHETRLCRFGARDYDASIGRWLSKDPILFAGGDTNLYGYVFNDPVNFIDPTGEIAFLPAIGIGAFVGGVSAAAGEIMFNDNWNRSSVFSSFIGGAAGGAITVATSGSNIVAAAGVSMARAAASTFAGLTFGAATTLITDPDSRPQPFKNRTPKNQCGD